MRRSRLFSLAPAVVVASGLAALGIGSLSTAAASTTGAHSSSHSSSGINVGTGVIKPRSSKSIILLDQSSPAYTYGVALAKNAVAEGKKLGYNVVVKYDNLTAATELANFQQAIESGKYAGILIEPFNTQLCVPIRTEAIKYQVLVEVVGTPLCNNGTGSTEKALWAPGTISYIGGQNSTAGALEVLNEAAKLQPGPQKAAFILGPNGYGSDTAWQVAWKEFSAKHSNWQLVATEYGDFTAPTSFTLAQNAISGNSGITAMFDPYIDATVGVVKAVQDSGKASQISVYDNGGGSTVAQQLVKAGELRGDLPVYPGSLGATGIHNLVEALKGTAPPRYVPGDGSPDADQNGVITKANVGQYKPQW